jgi:ABC-type branched-subunit amino acid transport system substrate-binding protein
VNKGRGTDRSDERSERRHHRTRGRLVVIIGVVAALALSACGSGTDTADEPSSTTSGATTPTDTSLGVGVTDDSVKVGIALVDFECIKQYTDSIRLNQQPVWEAFIKDINDKGGVAGRKIDPVFRSYCPLTNQQILTFCTSFAQDDNVFAVMGTFIDFSGDAQTCIAKQEKRLLVTFDLTQAIMDRSPPGYIVTPGSIPERGVDILLSLAEKEGTLDGKKVAILGDNNVRSIIENSIEPGLKDLGVELGSTAVLAISGGDTTQPQAQLDSFIEKWKTEGVDAIFMSGNYASAKQFVEKIRERMPNVMLLTDTNNTLQQAQQEQTAGKNPNPYEGMIAAGGLTAEESDASPNWKFCADIYEDQTGKKAPTRQETIKSADGKNIIDNWGTASDACQLLWFFHDIGDRVGKYLNNNNWVNTVNTFGEITNRTTGPYSSIHEGKYSAEDNWRLQVYDSTIGDDGDWKPLTDIQNISS